MNHGILSCVRWVRIRDSCELWDKGNVPPHATYVSSSISKGLFTSWTTKLSHVIWPFTMVTFSWSIFLKEYKKFKGCGHFSWTWIKRCDHAPKSGCVVFFLLHVQKGKFWGFPVFYLLPFFLPSFLLSTITFEKRKKKKKRKNGLSSIETTFLFHGLLTFVVKEPLMPLPLQIMLDMIVDDVGLKINLFQTSNSMVTLTFFSLTKSKVVPRWVQRPITYLSEQGTTSWWLM